MVKFTVEQLRKFMKNKSNIRNLSVIAHVDHGKTTLTDSLVSYAEIIAPSAAGNTRYMDNRKDEQLRCITIKSTSISLYHEQDNESFVINLIDSPGHVDFSSEVTAALRLTDGALVVVDCVEGVCVQTETVLHQALAERILPVLVLNKVDRIISELQMEPEEAYQSFLRSIESANVVISTYQDKDMGDLLLSPEKGTVAFASGYQGWAFTLDTFAKMYAEKFQVSENKMLSKLWGENYWDPAVKKWKKTPMGEDGSILKRSFVQFVLEPIYEVFRTFKGPSESEEKRWELTEKLGLKLTPEEKGEESKELLRTVMRKFLPAAPALLDMIVKHLPDPLVAQKVRASNLYTGPMEDRVSWSRFIHLPRPANINPAQYAEAIRQCDEDGPLIVYISKMVPSQEKGRFYAFGRIFSGCIRRGQKLRIMGASYVAGSTENVTVRQCQRIVLMMGKFAEMVEDVPCGNIVGIGGIDQYLSKNGTLTDEECVDAHPLRHMQYSVAPVVRVAVSPAVPSELPKLVEALKRLSTADPLVVCTVEESGEHVVAGAGELHLEICLNDLREYAGIDLKISNPVVPLEESVSEKGPMCLSKSANKLNRLFVNAEPLHNDLVQEIEEGSVRPGTDRKELSKKLSGEYGWDINDSKKVWCFGPDLEGPNLLVDTTKGVQYLQDVKDSISSSFQWATKQGVLCEERLRAVRINVLDALIHRDPAHRGANQIVNCFRRAVMAAELTSGPLVMEPMYLVEIQTTQETIGATYKCLFNRRGDIVSEEAKTNTPLYIIKAYLPVAESFGFTEELRSLTSGKAFPQCVFDHWEAVSGDPLDASTKAGTFVRAARKRKGLQLDVPPLDRYLDKL